MTREKILNWWYAPNNNINPFIYGVYNDGEIDYIESFHKSELLITKRRDGFVFYNAQLNAFTLYKFEDYGKTWAFSEEELTK